ncbi:MAG: outer membrane beta-barrel protein [Bacteroidales bacterium]|nr:outer membrane beta-barrel protein [Bacteroidales bacterium]
MMRKVVFFTLCLLLCAGFSVNAQRFKGELIAGFNLSQVDGDEVYGYTKFGANMGLGVMLPFSFKGKEDKNWAISMEMLWHQKGSKLKNHTNTNFCDTCPKEIPCDSTIKYRLDMDYVSLPVMLHYTDPYTGWTFGVGLSYNRLFRIREIENGVQSETSLLSETYKLQDVSMLADVYFPIYHQLKFNFRYEYSLYPIRIRTFNKKNGIPVDPYDRKQYHNMLTFRLIYMFNEPAEEAMEKRKP